MAALLLLLLVGLPGLVSPSSALAATPELTMVTAARYEVDPDEARIHVTVDITAVNHKKDTATRRYFFDKGSLAVLPGTSGLRVSADGLHPTVKLSKRTADYDLLAIGFGTKLMAGKSLDLRLEFDLKDAGGDAERDVRIGQSLATFPVWAFGTDDTPGSTVELVLPSDYHVEFAVGSIPGPTTVERTIVFRTGPLRRPLEFFAYVVADREGAYATTPLTITVGGDPVAVAIRAWSDDKSFAARVGDLFGRGLPVLGEAIGLDYPRRVTLTVQESVSRTLGGYAGLFDPATGRIQVDYAAGPFVILHEAAHVWFNGSLLGDRWADEAFASHYASVVASDLELADAPQPLTPELEAARIPLNAWGAIGESDAATDDYAYAAALELADAIAARAGDSGLRAVWTAAADRESAYQPRVAASEPERVDAAPDWRGLLDLLETKTGQRFDDLWRTWVVRPAEADVLADRATARADYDRVSAKAADWELPRAIRSALTTWQFAQASGLLAQADEVLTLRADIEAASTDAGLTPPDSLEIAFEGDRGLPAAHAEADAELAAIDAVGAAAATEPAEAGPLEMLGLLGSEPDGDMAAARAAFADGDLVAAVDHADSARAVWTSAGDVGGRRALSILGAALLVGLAIFLVIGGWRSRRAGRRRQHAHPVAAGSVAEGGLAPTDEPMAGGPSIDPTGPGGRAGS